MLASDPHRQPARMLPDPSSLALFLHAAEMGSISRAAAVSHIALAAASRRISLLEHHYKVKLLKRTARGVEPTAAGTAAIPQIRQLLNLIQKIDVDLGDYADGVTGHVRIQAATSALAQFLPQDLVSFSDLHPQVRMDVEERWTSEIVQAVRSGATDIGVIVDRESCDDLSLVEYRHDDLVAIAPASYDVRRSGVRFAELLVHDFVGLESSTALTRRLLVEAMAARGTLRLRVQVRSFDAVYRMVEAGLGVAVLPRNVVRTFATDERVCTVPLQDAWARRRMYVCVASMERLPTVARQLIEHMTRGGDGPDEDPSD